MTDQKGVSLLSPRAITSELLAWSCSAVLRHHVGRGRPLTVAQVSELTGTEIRTIDSHRMGSTSPTLSAFLRYAAVLPAEFANDIIALAGLTGAHSVDGTDATPHEILSDIASATAALAGHLSDGVFDHREEASFVPLAARLGLRLAAWSVARKNKKLAKQAMGRGAG